MESQKNQSQNINKVQKENEMIVYENNALIEKSKGVQIIKKADVIQKEVNIQKNETSSTASNDIRVSKLLEDDLKIKNNNNDLLDEDTLFTQDVIMI